MKIRYSEIFFSFQGEAEYAGTPAVWIRLFGCPLECNGFGQKDPTDPSSYVLPYQNVDLEGITSVDQLPVFEYGCDSSYSWSNRYKHLVTDETEAQVADRFEKILRDDCGITDKNWKHPVTGQPVMLCFTGGEPMQWQKAMHAIVMELRNRGHNLEIITIETNGFQKLNEIFFKDIVGDKKTHLHFATSPKMFTVSGERDAINFTNLYSYCGWSNTGVVKIVHNGSDAAWQELTDITPQLAPLRPKWDFWIMPVGATKEQQELPSVATIALEAMRRGWKVATRNHAYVFNNVIGR